MFFWYFCLRKSLRFALLVLILLLITFSVLFISTELKKSYYLASKDFQFQITAEATARTDYGLTYPLTYKFSITPSLGDIQVWKKSSITGVYEQVIEKTSSDIFNGIEVVRFDYESGYAYVSVLFPSVSNSIYIKFTRSTGENLNGVTFLNVTRYYDDRKAAAVFTMDDCGLVQLDDFKLASDVFVSKGVWVTAGFFHMGDFTAGTWANIQTIIDNGYVEPASHSMTHSHLPYDFDIETGDSKKLILDNLIMPALNRRGSFEYLFTWISPFSEYSDAMQANVGKHKYLTNISGFDSYVYDGNVPTWDTTNDLYEHWDRHALFAEATTLEQMNAQFDSDYSKGLIYHLGLHPQNLSWGAIDKFPLHLDHIKNKSDVWYVGMGHLMVYHYAVEKVKVEIISEYFNDMMNI